MMKTNERRFVPNSKPGRSCLRPGAILNPSLYKAFVLITGDHIREDDVCGSR